MVSVSWNTKFGMRRVRQNPPTLKEALLAAEGLTDDRDQQVEIAADLMGVPPAEARAALKAMMPSARDTVTILSSGRGPGARDFGARDAAPRVVVVERRASRRMIVKPAAMAAGAKIALRPRTAS